ncbi:hypothetical protein V8E54_004212 [Elaphomyces granulatus]
MPRRSDKYLFEKKLRSMIKDELIRSLIEPVLLEDAVYHNHLSDLVALADAIASLRYFNSRSIGSAGRLPINDVIAEFLNYPESPFLVNFRMMPESFWALVELLESKGSGDYWHQNSVAAAGGNPVFQQIAVALLCSWIGRWYIGEDQNEIEYWQRNNSSLPLAHAGTEAR